MPDLPSRLISALSDRYRIERELGAGGMATVYLAEDLKHQRQVAIKVLKPELAAVLGAERFVQEITTTAQLQHPHILPLFDSGTADGFLFYVMPYVEGETLRDKLNRETQFSVHEAVRIAREIADALDYAHRRGVIHRDIKPENILLHDGRPMVADFGIALALSAAAGGRMTETGMSLGTPHYMSPEQATADKEITGRSDVYSLASVLYEMLAGDPPHTGSSAQQIIVKIIADEARPVEEVRKSVPANVAAALAKALEKLPADRFETAKAFADALADPGFHAVGRAHLAAPAAGRTASLRNPVVWVSALVALTSATLAIWTWGSGRSAGPDPVVRFTVDLPAGYQPALAAAAGLDLAISPDGSTLAFPVLDPQGARQLFARRLDEATARAVPGTEGGFTPGFSGDGTSMQFWAAGRIQKVALSGGAPQVVGEYGATQTQTWSPGGDIIYAVAGRAELMRVSDGGGEARPAATVDSARGEIAQFFPLALPDGTHVLYMSWGRGGIEDVRIGLLDLPSGRATRLDVVGTSPLGMLDGHLIYTDASGTILAVRLDLETGQVDGQPLAVGSDVATSARGSAVAVLSPTGTLAYMPGSQESTLVLADGSGATPHLGDARAYSFPRYSPDGTKVALTVTSGTTSDIWLNDVATGNLTRLSSGGTVNERPEWSPDGSRVLFRSQRGARSALWWQPANGSGPASPLLADDRADYFEGVLTPDGRSLVYQVDTAGASVMMRDLEGDGTSRPIAATQATEDQARVSPDGRWVAYVTADPGAPQVMVQPLPGPGAKVQVSIRGGSEPVWSRDGRRLFYRTEGKFRVAEVAGTPTFQVLSRADFMDDTYLFAVAPHANYDVSPDGTKLLVLRGERQRLLVVHGWGAEVRAMLRNAEGR